MLNLTRPLIFFDLETTGTNVTQDRIVEISYIKIFPDNHEERDTIRINPGMHIPEASTAIHKIADEDVKDAPSFKDCAMSLIKIFEDSDIAGFNSNKFDVPLLIEEFARCGLNFNISGRFFVDVQNIFHKKEQRNLAAAYRFYCGAEMDNPHSATCDIDATYQVLLGQLKRYPDLENNVEALAKFSKIGNNIDLAGRIIEDENHEPIFNFGKHKGKKVKDVFLKEPSFFAWMLQGDFPKDTKDVVTRLYNLYKKK